MALPKTALASATYITPNGLSPTTGTTNYTFVAGVDVTASSAVFPSRHVSRPGVFTQGTAPEGTASNPTNDSRS